jgi:hypothetical protein
MSQKSTLDRASFLTLSSRLLLLLALLLPAGLVAPAATAHATPVSPATGTALDGLTTGEWISITEQIQADAIDPLLISPGNKLTASDGADQDVFGYSVAISGDTAVVGAPWQDSKGTDAGAV